MPSGRKFVNRCKLSFCSFLVSVRFDWSWSEVFSPCNKRVHIFFSLLRDGILKQFTPQYNKSIEEIERTVFETANSKVSSFILWYVCLLNRYLTVMQHATCMGLRYIVRKGLATANAQWARDHWVENGQPGLIKKSCHFLLWTFGDECQGWF